MSSIFNRGTRDRPNWYAKLKIDGVWRSMPTHQQTKVAARDWAEKREARIADGKPLEEPKPEEEHTFGQALDHWLEYHSAIALVSHADNVRRAKSLREAFGHLPMSQVTALRITEFRARKIAERKKGDDGKLAPARSPATVNQYLALLRAVLNHSVSSGWLATAPKVKQLKVPKQPFDYLKREEAERFLSWTRKNVPELFALYAVAIYRGLRMGELYGLTWSDLDFDRQTITVHRSYDQQHTKDKKPRDLPMGKELKMILRQWRDVCPKNHEGQLDRVFPLPSGKPRTQDKPPKGFHDHLAKARCHRVRFHDLRHTCASLLVMSGVALKTVQEYLGHSTVLVTERYAHLAPDHLAREADKLSLSIQGGLGKLVALGGRGGEFVVPEGLSESERVKWKLQHLPVVSMVDVDRGKPHKRTR